MLINKASLSVRHCVGEKGRYDLQALQLRAGSVAATDGCIAAVVNGAPDGLEARDFPVVEGSPLVAPMEQPKYLDAASAVIKFPTKPRLPILRTGLVTEKGIVTTDLSDSTITAFLPDAKINFPDFSKVIPKPSEKPTFQVILGLGVLQKLVKTLADFHGRGYGFGSDDIELSFYDPKSQFTGRAKNQHSQELLIVAMPCRRK